MTQLFDRLIIPILSVRKADQQGVLAPSLVCHAPIPALCSVIIVVILNNQIEPLLGQSGDFIAQVKYTGRRTI